MLKRWGQDFTRNREGGLFKPLILWENANVKGKNPSSCQPPFLSFMPSHLKLVKEFIPLGWERYGGQIRIWGVTHFWKTFSWLLGQVNAGKCLPKPFLSPMHLLPHAARDSWGHSPSCFCCFSSFFRGGEFDWECSVARILPRHFCCGFPHCCS